MAQALTGIGGVLAGLLGNDPRPAIAGAGGLTLLTVAVAWFAGLRKEYAAGVAGIRFLD